MKVNSYLFYSDLEINQLCNKKPIKVVLKSNIVRIFVKKNQHQKSKIRHLLRLIIDVLTIVYFFANKIVELQFFHEIF